MRRKTISMMKKHLHNSLRALFLSLAVLLSLPMLAEEVEIDGINYEFDADTERAAVIKKSSGEYSGEIVIPESVVYEDAAYSVTNIGLQAFYLCSGLTSVTIPNSVESIGSSAFAGCSILTSVTIGNSVRSIGDYAFAGCTELLNVYCYAENAPSTASKTFEESPIRDAILHVPAGSVDSYNTEPWSSFRTIVAISTEVEINGINYDLNGDATQATVVSKSGKYYGEVIIPESVEHEGTAYSVTSIGEEAFRDCSGLTSVTIPNSVTSIGSSAFNFCSGLTSVTIPNSVTSIGYQAFACSGLTSVTIGNNVESIGGAAFYDCSGLTSVTIPNSVTSIGYQAFCFCSGLTSVTIPNSVTSIGINAFALCSGLTSVTIGNGVESIGQLAFSDCSKLHDVYCYAKNVPYTESNAFEDSPIRTATLHVPAGSVDSYKTAPWNDFGTIVALTPFSGEVEIDGTNYELNGETKQATVIAKSVGEYSGEIVIPESVVYEGATYSVTSIGEEAFRGCSDLTSVTIGNSVTSIGKNAFRSCSDLTSVTIGNSVSSIGNYAFYECSGLTSVHISDIIAWCNIDFGGEYSNPLEYATLLYLNGEEVNDLEIPNSVTSIEGGAFSNCSGLTSVTIPNSVTSIGEGAFLGCSGLTSVTIPNSVTSIGSSAFLGCSALTSVTIPNSVESIGSGAFSGCSGLTSVTIPNSVTSIGHTAFSNCSDLTSVTIGNGVTSIEWGAFLGCSGLTSVTIPNSVESIGISAFNGCSALTSVSIPNSVTSIGSSAFEGCSGLTSVHISDIIAWCNIEFGDSYSNPLYKAHNLYLNEEEVKDLVIPNSVTSIGDYAFNGCSGLTSVTIPNSVTSIGDNAFYDCYHLTSVTIPNSVTSIGDGAFSGCSGLTSVTIPNSVTSIGNGAFSDCSDLTSVTIPNSVTSIGDLAFYSCTGLTSVTIGNGVESIGELAFANWENLLDVYCYAEDVPSTHSNAFEYSPIEDANLHVPAVSVDRYNETAPWSGFGKIVGLYKEYSLTVSSVGYSTLYLDFNAEIPEGVKAYVAKEVVDNRLKMERVEGVLPANTGVIIRAEGKYAFVESDVTPAEIGENLLVGSVVNTMVTAEDNTSYYILSASDNNVGMYPVELVDGTFVCKANKAYLPISSALARIYFDFGTETGIGEVKTENGEQKAEIYDLSGRKVQNAQKGLYIVNGKKVVK